MSNAQVSAAATARASGLVLTIALQFLGLAGDAAAATPGKIYFFATREACAASGAFTRQECVAAFLNASAELQDRAPRFASSGECRARFQLCEIRRLDPQDGEAMAYAETQAVAYVPLALGVEMILTGRGVEAAPTLAVETSANMFPKFPVSERYAARPSPREETTAMAGQSAILPADRFQPFPKSAPIDVRATFAPFALGALDDAASSEAARESPAERRARLKSAPFVE